MVKIHPTAIVHPKAELGKDVEIGPYSIVETDVTIDDGCLIQSHVVIDSGTRLGKEVKIAHGAVVGTAPQDLKYRGEKTFLEIGDRTTIREFATLNRGTDHSFKTVVGKDSLLMAYVHVAHDCVIGDHVVLSNAINMAGHVTIEDYVGIGGMTAIHQFVKIGRHCFVGGGVRVTKDVPPYVLATGEPLQYAGINKTGLERRGFTPDVLAEIKRAYKAIFRSPMTKAEALKDIKENMTMSPVIESIIRFAENTDRGMIKGE